MFTLIVDTSTEKGVIAIAHKERVLLETLLDFQVTKSSSLILNTLKKSFAKLNISPSDLKAIGVSIGPGLFTGIRVGAAFALGLATPFHLPLIEFSSLTGFISEKEGPFLSFIDAKVGGAFIQERVKEGDIVSNLSPPQYYLADEVKKKMSLPTRTISPFFGKWVIEGGEERFPNSQILSSEIEREFLAKNFKFNRLDLRYRVEK